MIEKTIKSGMLSRSTLALLCTIVFCIASEDTSYTQLSIDKVIYEYKSSGLDPEIRRREAGLSEEEKQALGGDGSTVRGAARGIVRGAARGEVRGAARGTARGAVRGAARGTARGIVRGVARGTARGEIRGATRGEVRGTARGEVRGVARGEIRGAARGEVRGTARGETRGVVRGEMRGTARGEVRGVARSELQRSRIEWMYAEYEDTLNLLPDRIEPLAPQGIGYSHDSQPNLYFYMNKPSSRPIEFTLNREDALDPVIISYIPVDTDSKMIDSGIHSVSLEELGVVLEEGVEYEWFVTIVVDIVERSGDIVASGIVTHKKNSLVKVELPEQDLYRMYAVNGYWYDAIDSVMSLRQNDEQAAALNQQLIHWLTQEKLPSARTFLGKSAPETKEPQDV